MRVNVYAEEITQRVEIVDAIAGTGTRFIGVRFSLKTHEDMLMPKHQDNDDSAVTFWVKSGKGGFQPKDARFLLELFDRAAELLADIANSVEDA